MLDDGSPRESPGRLSSSVRKGEEAGSDGGQFGWVEHDTDEVLREVVDEHHGRGTVGRASPYAAGPMSTDGTAEDRLCESRQAVFQVQLGLHDLPILP